MTSHFDALPFVLLSGVHQALIKPLPVGQLYHSGWPPLVPDAVPVGVGDWCCWQGRGSGGGLGGGMLVSLPLEAKRESSLLL